MGRIIHFELTADDLPGTLGFLRTALGWTDEPSPYVGEYHLVDTGAGAGVDGAVMASAYNRQAVIPWVEVDDLDATLARVTGAGGHAGDVNELPGQGRVVYVTTPEGTVLGLEPIAAG